MTELPSGTVTFLFADVEGSTQLLQRLGERYEDVLRDYRAILRERLREHGGHEVDTQGDAFFHSFRRAREAVAGAVAVQRGLASHEWPDGTAVRVRMGVHTGEPSVGDEGYLGLDVVRAARICSTARGGQILISDSTRALLGGGLPEGTQMVDLGRQSLKDLEEEHLYQVSIEGMTDSLPVPAAGEASGGTVPTGADVLGERFEQRIEEFVNRQIGESFEGGRGPGGRSVADFVARQRKPKSRRSPLGWIVRGTFLAVVGIGAAALIVYLIRALF